MSNNKLDVNAEYLRQQANLNHQYELEGIKRNEDMLDDDDDMMPVRAAWAHHAQLYQDKLNNSIKAANAEKDKIFKYALNRPANNQDVPASIKDIIAERKPFDNKRIQDLTTKTNKGGKSRVFRKKSNKTKTKTKKVSRRNRRSRNIRRSRNSRAHELK